MTSKISIKLGSIEISFEGSEQFIKNDLLELYEKITTLDGRPTATINFTEIGDTNSSTSIIAQKLGGATGPELVLSACTYLHFVKHQTSFERKEILEEMKGAKSYYKKIYSNILSRDLKAMVKQNKLLEQGTNVYALHSNSIKEISSKLA